MNTFGVRYFGFVTTDARRLQNFILFSSLSSSPVKYHNYLKSKVFGTEIYKHDLQVVMRFA